METTQEKTMQMAEESMQESPMAESMDEMVAEPKSMDKMPECAIVGLIIV